MFELSATVKNRIRLAAALDNAGEYKEAVIKFEACLNGPFANDPELMLSAASCQPNSTCIRLTVGAQAKSSRI